MFLAKLDLQNAYWSIKLPPLWRRVFVVQGGVREEIPLCPPALRLELQPGHLPATGSCSGPQGTLEEGDQGVGVFR